MTVIHGDARDEVARLDEDSIDAIVTDPPYELGFMGKKWDGTGIAYDPDFWRECLRVLKPGGHLLSFGGSRTWHRIAVGIEDAGFDIRDSIAWLYATGFPKSLDVSKAIDKAAGAEREVVGYRPNINRTKRRDEAGAFHSSEGGMFREDRDTFADTAPATDEARTWQGWGTALKPAFEPIVVARKPLSGTVAANVTTWGTGALNIDGTRVGRVEGDRTEYGRDRHLPHANTTASLGKFPEVTPYEPHAAGRWPTNVVLNDSEAESLGEPAKFFPTFRYQAKAPTRERPKANGVAHPTVKPLELMRWLVRLVTPPGGIVLDPFAGSGTTLEAAMLEGFRFIGIEGEADYLPLIEARIQRAKLSLGKGD